eukprot:scaffold150086_cov56-Cyclotella_meneghiniana.AAC.2
MSNNNESEERGLSSSPPSHYSDNPPETTISPNEEEATTSSSSSSSPIVVTHGGNNNNNNGVETINENEYNDNNNNNTTTNNNDAPIPSSQDVNLLQYEADKTTDRPDDDVVTVADDATSTEDNYRLSVDTVGTINSLIPPSQDENLVRYEVSIRDRDVGMKSKILSERRDTTTTTALSNTALSADGDYVSLSRNNNTRIGVHPEQLNNTLLREASSHNVVIDHAMSINTSHNIPNENSRQVRSVSLLTAETTSIQIDSIDYYYTDTNNDGDILIPHATLVPPADEEHNITIIPNACIIEPERYSMIVMGRNINFRYLTMGVLISFAVVVSLSIHFTRRQFQLNGEELSISSTTMDSVPSTSPTKFCYDTPDWKDVANDGCRWYEKNDRPGCPDFGNDSEWAGDNTGMATDHCCYCGGGIKSSSDTTIDAVVSPSDSPSYSGSPSISGSPSVRPSSSSIPSITCYDTYNWRDTFGFVCDWYRKHDEPGCPVLGRIHITDFEYLDDDDYDDDDDYEYDDDYHRYDDDTYDEGVAKDNCCYCGGGSHTLTPTTSRYPSTFPTKSSAPSGSSFPSIGPSDSSSSSARREG